MLKSKGRYTHGGAKRGTNRKAGSIHAYTIGHRKSIVGHTMHPTRVHGTGRAT